MMTTDNTTENTQQLVEVTTPPIIDENLAIFVYGSIVIRDVESGNVLVKKSF